MMTEYGPTPISSCNVGVYNAQAGTYFLNISGAIGSRFSLGVQAP